MESLTEQISSFPLLTRYLYISFDVYYSLLKSLGISPKTRQIALNGEAELSSTTEVLFWTFELYYSGFKEKTINALREISEIYTPEKDNLPSQATEKPSKIMNLLFQEYDDWFSSRSHENQMKEDILIANIVENLRHKIKFYHDFSTLSPEKNKSNIKKRCLVRLSYENEFYIYHSKDISPIHIFDGGITGVKNEFFETKCRKIKKVTIRDLAKTPEIKHYHVLKTCCLYESYKWDETQETNDSLKQYIPNCYQIRNEIITSMYNGNWLYYCYHTPVWRERIDRFNGQINHDTKTILFPEQIGGGTKNVKLSSSSQASKNFFVSSVTTEDIFNENYDYEPDNNMYIIEWIAGTNPNRMDCRNEAIK